MTDKIRVAIVSGILHHSAGGPTTVLSRHFQALRQTMDVTVFGVAEAQHIDEVQKNLPGSHVFPLTWPRRWFRGTGLAEALQTSLPNYDIIHAHMIWDHPVWVAGKIAKQGQIPLIITPHGSMMAPWRYHRWHKKLYRHLILDKIFQEAAFLHVLNHQEEQACRQAGVTTPIRIIANGLEAAEFQQTGEKSQALQRWPQLAGKQVLLYLGRLWSEKGLGDLLEAWAKLADETNATPWILVLAGPDYRNYRQILLKKMQTLHISYDGTPQSRVFLPGEVSGQAKADLLTLASGFILPSHSEGFSSALLEAMAAGLPAVYSEGCHFSELAQCGGGIEVPIGPDGTLAGIRQLFTLNHSDRTQMGMRAKALAKNSFTMEKVASDLHALYQEAIQKQHRQGDNPLGHP